MALSGSLNFISASNIVSYHASGAPAPTYGTPASNPNSLSVGNPVDFVGLNWLIYDPITSSHNLLRIHGDTEHNTADYLRSGVSYNPIFPTHGLAGGAGAPEGTIFNSILRLF